jgi:hypothetical protein
MEETRPVFGHQIAIKNFEDFYIYLEFLMSLKNKYKKQA